MGTRGRVLFVDDGGQIRPAVDGMDAETIEATDGTDVLKRLDHESVDVVVLPGELPDLPLEVVCRRLVQRLDHHPPIVVGGRGRAPMIQVPGDASAPALADRIGQALQDRRLGQAMDRHERVERALLRVTDRVVDAGDAEAVQQAIADELRSIGVYQFVAVGRCLGDDIEVSGPINGRVAPGELGSLLGALDPAFVEASLTSGEVTVVDASGDAAVLAAVPLTTGDRPAGIAIVGAGDTPDRTEQSLLGRIGRLGGLALAQAPETDGRLDRAETLVRMLDHELRNELQTATLSLATARDAGDADAFDRLARSLDAMETALEAGRALASTDGVSDTEPVDVGALAEAAWQSISAPRATLSVGETTEVAAHPALLERLFANLLANAVEHAGPAVIVRVGATPDGFYVEDDGPGIPAGKHRSVFDWGYTTSMDGLGVGLSVVQEIVDAHGWSLSLTEGREGGARFEVSVSSPATAETLESLFGREENGFVFEGEPGTE